MTDYPSNSNKSKSENQSLVPEKRVEKVVTGTAKVKKKSEVRKFTDVFLQEDMNSVKDYIIMDVIVPAVKTAISDVVKNGIDMLLYGENGIHQKKSNASRVSYRSYYGQNNSDSRSRQSDSPRRVYSYDSVTIDSRGEAEEVLVRMDELIATYGLVRVADFYELVGVSGTWTDNNYGWTDIRNASIIRTRDGYMIKLPKAMPLD